MVSNPIGLGSLSASGSETFAHYHDEGHANHHPGSPRESSSAIDLRPRKSNLSCNTSYEELVDENSAASAVGGPPPEAEESTHSVASVKVGNRERNGPGAVVDNVWHNTNERASARVECLVSRTAATK